jgi:glycosyltransferase involved in cell wall biosynthesis
MARPTLFLHGNFHRPCGFTLINARLRAGLDRAGFDVRPVPLDVGDAGQPLPGGMPDVYLFHGDPYEFRPPPARLRVFFLQWEYLEVPGEWVRVLNSHFDLVVVASEAARRVGESSGIRLPIVVCPGAVDADEFNPGATPVRLETGKRYRFLHLGGAHERRGTDLLLRAYMSEFSATDDVVLLLKAFHYAHHRPWLMSLMEELGVGSGTGPEVLYIPDFVPSVAGYCRAADTGVFPVRAECLGLPVLENLACGTPVIVTGGTGLDEFCTDSNAWFVSAKRCRKGHKLQYLPEVSCLRALMRQAYERGNATEAERRRVAATVTRFRWETSVSRLATALFRQLHGGRPRTTPRKTPRSGRIRHLHGGRMDSGCAALNRLLGRSMARLRAQGRAPAERPGSLPVQMILAEADYALGAFADVEGAEALRVLYHLPTTERLHDNRERELCGLKPLSEAPYRTWRRDREKELADLVLAFSGSEAERLRQAAVAPARIRTLDPGFPCGHELPPVQGEALTFLFVSYAPFRDGIRVLLDAWSRCDPAGARLLCLVAPEALKASLVLRHLVGNPSIDIRPLNRERDGVAAMADASCVVSPAFIDSLSFWPRKAMACGLPVLVSDASAVAERVRCGTDGLLFETGSAEALAQGLARLTESRETRQRIGRAAGALTRRAGPPRLERHLLKLRRQYAEGR